MTVPRVLFSTGSLYVLDLAHTFELVADAGYDGVEVMCDERYSTRDPHYLERLSKTFNLPIVVLHTPFSPRTPGWREPHSEVARIHHTLKLAEQTKAETIVVHLPRRREHLTISVNKRTWHIPWRLAESPVKTWIEQDLPNVQAGTKVKLALENMPVKRILGQPVDNTLWNDVEPWSRVHEWLTLDTTHWATKRVNPTDAYHAAKGRVCHVHLSNYNGHEHQLPHEGSLNLKAFLRTLASSGYSGTISLELNPHVLVFKESRVLKRNLRASLDFCRQHLA